MLLVFHSLAFPTSGHRFLACLSSSAIKTPYSPKAQTQKAELVACALLNPSVSADFEYEDNTHGSSSGVSFTDKTGFVSVI
jgi:hypothetical protein